MPCRTCISPLAALAIFWSTGTALGQAPARAAAADTEQDLIRAAAALYADVRITTLDNGLRVVLKPIAGSPVVTTMVAYKVGSADEDLQSTGLSHYLEHLMFKGTDTIMPGDIDRLTQRNGGANNANTSEDLTVYYFDFAADRFEIALKIEADRMRGLRIDARHEFEQEKGAVIEELQRDEDEPWDLEQKAILPLLFGPKAPYGHPVIGLETHVRAATARIIKAHYDTWYHPNNAVLVVCGGFDPDKMLATIKKQFGPIPRGRLPARKTVPAFQRSGPVRKTMVSKFDSPRLLLGFNGVKSGAADFYALEVIQELLSGGKTGRLYKTLVEGEKVANTVSTSNNAGRYAGWFSIQVELLQGQDADRGEKLVLAELKRMGTEKVGAAELRRVRRRLLAGTIFSRESVHGLADSLARGLTINDLDFLKTYLAKIEAVTAEDIQNAARKYLDPEKRVTVVSIPPKKGVKAISDLRLQLADCRSCPIPDPQSAIYNLKSVIRPSRSFSRARDTSGASAFSLPATERVVLDNGLTLLLLENHRLPIVVARAFVRHVNFLEPAEKAGLEVLTGMLLDEGTSAHTGPEIAELIENVGGLLETGGSGGSVKVLAPDRRLGLELLFDCLTRPTFPAKEFARQRNRLLSRIDDLEQQPDARAGQAFRALVYGKHPLGRPALGTRMSVASLSAEDCRAFHRQVFVPNNTVVVVVGDFERKDVIAEIKRFTAGWNKAQLAKPDLPAVPLPARFTEKVISMPRAAQLHFFMGHVGIRRASPDYYKLLVMDNVLGTGPGFTDRLSARLRDRMGLAYTVSASIASTAGEEPGLFSCYIGTRPDKLALVKKIFLEELERIRKENPTAQEVDDAKKYLLGSLPFRLTSSAAVAELLLAIEQYHLGLTYLDDYRKAVAAVTPEDVRAVAAKHLHPDRMVLAVAGAIDKNGKPLGNLSTPAEKEKE
jgi:zinc protease